MGKILESHDGKKRLYRSTRIYRIVPIQRLRIQFSEQLNALARPRLWVDPYENFALKSIWQINNKFGSSLMHLDVFAQCWTTSSFSDALWRIYATDESYVRVRTTVGKLLEGLSTAQKVVDTGGHVYAGKVRYLNDTELRNFAGSHFLNGLDEDRENVAESLLIKRRAFQHENEVRLVFIVPGGAGINDDLFSYEFNPHEVIDQVMFHPSLSVKKFIALRKEFIDETSFSGKVKRSLLYTFPENFVIKVGSD